MMNHKTTTNVETHAHPCGCQEPPSKPITCCNLVCFERPNYFCGHLLTDADLALEQKYLVEKNKLRNRTLQGHGVVCGLALTCDCECAGYIRIGTGYAIDDCGNDLILCESKRFDVLGALRKKQWLLGESEPEPCEPGEDPLDCEIKQCFYIAICYEEEFAEYTTPFDAGCGSGPKQCLPTRVREKVRIEVLDKLPKHPSYIQELKARVEKCFLSFSEGQIGKTLKQNLDRVDEAISGNAGSNGESRESKDPFCDLFCLLRAQFLQHLKLYPAEQTCGLYKQVKDLSCPARGSEDYGKTVKEVFCQLIELMLTYQYECVLSEAIFTCPEPCEASCVILGTVEVKGGNLVRVCNTPRSYVWTFSNLLPLLYQYILTRAPKTSSASFSTSADGRVVHTDDNHEESECCPDLLPPGSCEAFLGRFRVRQDSTRLAVTAPLLATEEFLGSILQGFNYTDPMAISPYLFQQKTVEELNKTAEDFGIKVHTVENMEELAPRNPFNKLLANMLIPRGAEITAGQPREGEPFIVTPQLSGSPGEAQEAHRLATEATSEIGNLKELLKAREQEISKLSDSLKKINKRIDDMRSERPNG